jgi:hypothetical protein
MMEIVRGRKRAIAPLCCFSRISFLGYVYGLREGLRGPSGRTRHGPSACAQTLPPNRRVQAAYQGSCSGVVLSLCRTITSEGHKFSLCRALRVLTQCSPLAALLCANLPSQRITVWSVHLRRGEDLDSHASFGVCSWSGSGVFFLQHPSRLPTTFFQ